MNVPQMLRQAFVLVLVAAIAPLRVQALTWEDSVPAPGATAGSGEAESPPPPPRPRPIPLPDETRARSQWLNPQDRGYPPPTAVPAPGQSNGQPVTPVDPQVPEYQFDLVVRYGDLEGGTTTFAVDHNAVVTLVVDADAVDTLRIQDYNLSLPVQPGRPAILRFRAERPGRFAIWYGGVMHEIATLEVGPPTPARSGPLPWSFE